MITLKNCNWSPPHYYCYTTGCLLDYNCFNKYYKMIKTDLTQQQALDADPKAIP